MKRPTGEAKWSAQCIAAANEFLVYIFTWVRLIQPDPMGFVVVHPSLEGKACFVPLTQLGPGKAECPKAFVVRY